MLIGGSPCQSLSITRGEIRTNLDGKSKLFFEYVRALQEVKPKYFLFENVASMNDESKNIISDLLGCKPIFIDSKCFSAQSRPRLYWTNIPNVITDLPESNMCLNDILETDVDSSYFYDYPIINVDMTKQVCGTLDFKINEMHKRVFNPNFKVHTLTCCAGGNLQKKVMVNGRARKLTPLEYERLQTLPDGYTEGVAKTHRYNSIGNGWTVDVIAYILSNIKTKKENKRMNLYEIENSILDCVDMETGEVFDIKKFEELALTRDAKIENICLWIKNLKAEADALKAEKDSFAERQKAAENKMESLKKYISGYLAGNKFESPKVKVSFRKSESLEISEGADIPMEYLKLAAPTVDKMALKSAVKDGLQLEGVQLVENQNIQIK